MLNPLTLRRASLLLIITALLLFAGFAVLLGKEAGWDLQNYHWYDPYALIHGRLGFDIAVAHHATYYNPLLDLPLYFVATHAPAWLAGAALGILFGVMVVLIAAIAYVVLPIANPYWRLAIAAALALLGGTGGGALSAIGNPANDVPASIGMFAALLLLLRKFEALASTTANSKLLINLLVAGACAGLSIGLKLTTAIYAPGLVAALLIASTPMHLRQRIYILIAFSTGIVLGWLLVGGYWMFSMWHYSGNPVFPYFNQIFHSPLAVADSYRDPNDLPQDWLSAWLYPFYFTADSHLVAEWTFRDAHVLLAYLIIPVTTIWLLIKRRDAQHSARNSTQARPTIFLFTFAGVSYLAWLKMFGVYRYLIPLEMLAPLLITIAILWWPIKRTAQISLLVALMIAMQSIVSNQLKRMPWDNKYVSVQAPALLDPSHSMILMAGNAALAFTIPAFPEQIPFLRIDGWMVGKEDHVSGLALQLHERVTQHQGELYLMFAANEAGNAADAAREYNLQFAAEPCQWVKSNLITAIELCRVVKRT